MSHPGLVEWLAGSDKGLSSECMAFRLGFGLDTERRDHPWDPSDFGRCERLLRAVPTLRPLLPAMSVVSPAWAALVEKWDQIVKVMESEVPGCFTYRHSHGAAPRGYALMKACYGREVS